MAQHLSIRVPWKDNGYGGLVCDNPCRNNACLRLKNVSENRDDDFESEMAGKPMLGHEERFPCLSEGGAFMSSCAHFKTTIHPYKNSRKNISHTHFLPTEQKYPAFSVPARPFRWTMLHKSEDEKNIENIAALHCVDYDHSREPHLNFPTIWVQEGKNQKALFDAFYRNVEPSKSLVVLYAKQVPFVDDTRRVVIGIGFVSGLERETPHNTSDPEKLQSMLWESMVLHSIRDGYENGFLFPYAELMKYAESQDDFDISTATVFGSDDYFEEFSYATEHLSHDAVIDVLLQSLKVLDVIRNCRIHVDSVDWGKCADWVKARLDEVWVDRGAYPGLGSMLFSCGFSHGLFIADDIKAALSDCNHDIEAAINKAINESDALLSDENAKSITAINRKAWLGLPAERKELFLLLSRFNLSVEWAKKLFLPEERKAVGIDCRDFDIIRNPYALYERTRLLEPALQFPVRKIDLAVFPPSIIATRFPVPAPTALESANDERRIRAIAVNVLESHALNGHTVYPMNLLINEIKALPLEPNCPITSDVLSAIEDFLLDEIIPIETAGDDQAYKLARFEEMDEIIRSSINRRIGGEPLPVKADWRKVLDTKLQEEGVGAACDEKEEQAREEKADALRILATSRVSVLTGGAGTGKTTVLASLCSQADIANGGILLLAPTGKSRVVMQDKVKANALTVAQFLMKCDRYDYRTMTYSLSNAPAKDVPETVIIDECSMLTEEMMGALLDALKRGAKRIIFVGDPNQLPPIGAGRPFVDLAEHLKKKSVSYAELTVTRRQISNDGSMRSDTKFAEYYKKDPKDLDEGIFAYLQSKAVDDHIILETWETQEQLEQRILTVLKDELQLKDVDDTNGFDQSLGGKIVGRSTYFNCGETQAERWQVLAPVRNVPHGVLNINRILHRKYRATFIELAERGASERIPRPMGAEGIVYGDKVINLLNGNRWAYSFDTRQSGKSYVANGEIGVAVAGKAGKLQVEFSSQKKIAYQYRFGNSEEGIAPLELAYALTVHKAQGSEFDTVILILGEPCLLLSRELLYTALTRQKKKIVILYNGKAIDLKKYAFFSDIASRFTDLFELPNITETEINHRKRYYEARLIHKTEDGTLVRSKSEVIIYDQLYRAGLRPEYEKDLEIAGMTYIPDFTIDDAESGKVIYWEHCGMMTDVAYRARWERKKEIYAQNGIVEGRNLIVTHDEPNGGINSQKIAKMIREFFG